MSFARKQSSFQPHVEQLEERETPSASPGSLQSFDQVGAPSLPVDWQQWSSAAPSFSVSKVSPFSGTNALRTTGESYVHARSWLNETLAADIGVQATVFADSLTPVQIFARGQNLDGKTPTFYAATITRGLQIELFRVVDGVATSLGSLNSASYLSGKWVRLSLTLKGDQLTVEVFRTDTRQYLNTAGNWVSSSVRAMEVTDAVISNGGFAGINRPARYAGRVTIDDFRVLAPDGPTISENFNATAPNGTPAGWSRWSNDGALGFGSSATRSVDGLGLTSSGSSTRASRAWVNDLLSSDLNATASVYVDSLVPAQLFIRGKDLSSATPDYYAVTIIRGLSVSIAKVMDGVSTDLALLRSNAYTSGLWLRVSLAAQGDHLQARIQRLDTGAWLNTFGDWQAEPAAALDAYDSTLTGNGHAGLARPAAYAGNVAYDNFEVKPGGGDITSPSLSMIVPSGGKNLSNVVAIPVTTADASGIAKVEYAVDNQVVGVQSKGPYQWNLDTRNFGNGTHQIAVRSYDNAGNVITATTAVTFSNVASFTLPAIPAHYSHIRVAALAYSGNPMGAYEQNLLTNSIDLVVPNPKYLSTINQASSNTPQLIYSNVSNLYQELLLDWLEYADSRDLSREAAFYHVAAATNFTGASASSQPVTWFWNVQLGPASGTTGYKKLTGESRDAKVGDVALGAAGQALYVGFTDPFREINLEIARAKQAGWTYVVEYASTVEPEGVATGWKALALKTDTTNGLNGSGQWTFDPPSDWQASMLPGATAPLYYVRIRTTAGTAALAPVASSILGRDFVNAKGGSTGTIPAFDASADKDGDGYLSDAEYASRTAGKDARFFYESRLFYPYYGQMRYITNPGSAAVQAWAADYHQRVLASQPLADGIFMDNSSGKNPIAGVATHETTAAYAAEYSTLLATVNRAIAPRWVMANTSNGGSDTDFVVRQVPGTMEEFAIRAMAHNWQQFQDLATTVAHRQSVIDPTGYMVLDSLSTGGVPTDARTQMATLSYYYLLSNPNTTMLMLWGGEEPASTWSRHWFNALTTNVGNPLGNLSLFATGLDPANSALTYNVYQRQYENALVLYKPLSYGQGTGNGTTADTSATTHLLGGAYRVLAADGTYGPTVTSITLRNGEGVVLLKV